MTTEPRRGSALHVAAQGVAWLMLAAALPLAAQEVYRWVDEDGVVHYGDRPPQNGARPADLPPLQTIPAERLAPQQAASAEASPGATSSSGRPRLQLVAPSPEATIRGAERQFEVSAQVAGPIPDGARFVFLLDGNAVRTESAPSTTLSDVERGSHLVAVSLIGRDGRELARTDPVIVHVKPPTVPNPAGPAVN